MQSNLSAESMYVDTLSPVCVAMLYRAFPNPCNSHSTAGCVKWTINFVV